MKHKSLASAFVFLALAGLAATGAPAAGTSSPAAREARVAGGAKVPLVRPALSAEQLSALRPGFRALRPKARSNIE